METTFYPVSFSHVDCGDITIVALFVAPNGEMVTLGVCSGCGVSMESPFRLPEIIEKCCPSNTPANLEIDLANIRPVNKIMC